MHRWPFLFGLAALTWAQISTAWKWHGYGENNFTSSSIPVFNTGNGRMGTLKVLGDTVYVLGTYKKLGSNFLPLPKVPGDPANPSVDASFNLCASTYLAAYNRQTGYVLWWLNLTPHSSNSNGDVEGQDFVVLPDGKIYLLLHTNANNHGFEWKLKVASGSQSNGSMGANPGSLFANNNRISLILEIDPSSSSVQLRKAIGITDVQGEVHLKYLYYTQDTLYVTGDYIVQGIGTWSLSDNLASPLFCKTSSLCNNTSASNEWRGLIIGYATGSWSRIRAAEVRYESGSGDPVRGHRLAKDPVTGQLRWIIEVDRTNSKPLLYNQNPGSLASSPPISFSSPVATLYVLSLYPDLSLPPIPNYHELAQKSGTGIPPAEIFLQAHGDSILWVRSVDYAVDITNGSSSSYHSLPNPPYILIVRQQLSAGSNYATTLSYQGITELNTGSPPAPSLADVATERGWELVYLMGKAYIPTGALGDLLNTPNDRDFGFLLGLRYRGGNYQLMGGRAFRSLSSHPFLKDVEVVAGAYDSLRAQFYLMGTAEDSLWVRRLWPMGGNDTVRVCTVFGGSGLWLGRLDWYRLLTVGDYTKCTPDTIAPPLFVQVAGKNVHNSDVPPGTPAGWRFGWIPASPPWRSTKAPLDIIGPIMGTQEGTYNYLLNLISKGSYQPGSYYLAGTVYPVLQNLWVDIIDTLKLHVSGTTIPSVRRTTSTASTFMVTPYAGKPSAGYISGPYPQHRSGSWKFQFINALYYHPYYYAPPAYKGREMLFVITHTSPHQIWGIDLSTGMVDSLPVPSTSTAYRYFMDPVRGTYWAHEIPNSNIYAARIRRAPFATTSDALIQQGTTCVTTVGSAYPLRYTQAWLKDIHRAAVLPNGDFVFIADACPNAKYSLWRVSLATDSVYRVTGYTTLGSTCPQDGIGNSAIIGYFPYTNLAVWGDTVYWIENAFASTCLSLSGSYMLIRKAYPYGSITSYKVETLDTIPHSSSVAEYLLFSPLPTPGLIFGTHGTNQAMIRFDLATRKQDTLIRCSTGGSGCCSYGLSDWINGLTHTAAILRGGAIVIEQFGSLRLAVPIALSGSGDTLAVSASVGSVASVGGAGVTPTFSGSTIQFGWPSAGGPGLDSTYLAISLSGCDNGKPLYYPFYHLPKFGVWLKASDTVCLGQVFHSYVGRDTEVVDNGCRVSHRLFQVATSQGSLSQIIGENEVHRWKAIQAGYDTIRSVIAAPKWSYLVSSDSLSYPIHILQGYRLRLTTAMEGPYNSTTFLHKRHPFLRRYNIAAYNQGTLGVSPDSLWRLPYSPGDSLMKVWNNLLVEPSGSCPGAGSWYCDTAWVNLARVELRESVSGPVVDSTYALIDSAGRLYFYGAPLSAIGASIGSADTLHFCHCNPTTPKYLTVRFPNHLPLHTPMLSLSLRGVGEADSIDLRDPTYLDGIPGEHYTFVPGPAGTVRAAAWAGNCADQYNSFLPGGAHIDASQINAADYDFVITRNGITSGFSIADLNSDGVVDALDATIVIDNQNHLRQSSRP